jgi:hypothetical protein
MISKFSVFIIVIVAVTGLDAVCPQAENRISTEAGTISVTKIEPPTEAPTPAPVYFE